MKLILCVDDQGGLSFNHRRQSQDRAVRDDILQMCGDTKLWITTYTAKQFQQQNNLLILQNDFDNIVSNDFYFIEDINPEPYINAANEIILYHWNRRYPADRKLELPLSGWKCVQRTDFPGYSHDKITKEVYMR